MGAGQRSRWKASRYSWPRGSSGHRHPDRGSIHLPSHQAGKRGLVPEPFGVALPAVDRRPAQRKCAGVRPGPFGASTPTGVAGWSRHLRPPFACRCLMGLNGSSPVGASLKLQRGGFSPARQRVGDVRSIPPSPWAPRARGSGVPGSSGGVHRRAAPMRPAKADPAGGQPAEGDRSHGIHSSRRGRRRGPVHPVADARHPLHRGNRPGRRVRPAARAGRAQRAPVRRRRGLHRRGRDAARGGAGRRDGGRAAADARGGRPAGAGGGLPPLDREAGLAHHRGRAAPGGPPPARGAPWAQPGK